MLYSSPKAGIHTQLMAALKLRNEISACVWALQLHWNLFMGRGCLAVSSSMQHGASNTVSSVWNNLHFPLFCDDALRLPFMWFWTFTQLRTKTIAAFVPTVLLFFFSSPCCVLAAVWWLRLYCILLTVRMSIQNELIFQHWW